MVEQLPHIVRIHPVTGRIARPWRGRDHNFQLAATDRPRPGTGRAPALLVDDYAAAVDLVRAGHPIRMYDGSARLGFVAPSMLRISLAPCDNPETLWAYALPAPPCTRETLEREARAAAHLVAARWHQGADSLTSLAHAAYDSAFRQGSDRALSAAGFAATLDVLAGWRAKGRDGGRSCPALRHTLRAAALRAGLVRRELAAVAAVLDLPLAAGLGALAGLGYAAARNSLSQAGLRAAVDEDPAALLNWLDGRRKFAPLREEERRFKVAG
jgi:hypothetical protein